jgi:hypothetical protein
MKVETDYPGGKAEDGEGDDAGDEAVGKGEGGGPVL